MSTNERMPLNLCDYDISERTGFLLENPLEYLPEYFQPWNTLAKKMPEFVKAGTFREKVQQMPLLDHSCLADEREKRLAYLQLTLIASGYVWQDQNNVPKVLPECVAVPLWFVANSLGIQPVISHPGIFLANWKLSDPNRDTTLENFRCLYNLPGGGDAEAFFCILNKIEMDFVPGIKAIVSGVHAMESHDSSSLIMALQTIRDVIYTMKETFTNIHRLVSAEVFYNEIKPFLGGWGYGSSKFPDGIVYGGVSQAPEQRSGDTGAQTSIFASLDAFLGVEHPESNAFLLRMLDYMPPGHRRFIQELKVRSSLDEYVKTKGCKKLSQVYNDCLTALTDFRGYHLNVVAKYIVVMSKSDKTRSEETKDGKKEDGEITGTGGTKLMPFLKTIRTDTLEKKLP